MLDLWGLVAMLEESPDVYQIVEGKHQAVTKGD